jgi:hypothetical protein
VQVEKKHSGALAVLLHVELFPVTFTYRQRELGGAEEQSRLRMDVHAAVLSYRFIS